MDSLTEPALNNLMQSTGLNCIATCMHYTGPDPLTKKPVHTARGIDDRKMQRADAVLQARELVHGA